MEQLENRVLMDACPGIIVYCAPGVGGAYDIYSVNADGTNVRNITQSAAFDAYPQVTEDGTMIAFTSNLANPASSARDVYTMNIDGSNLRRITFDGASWDPSLSYDKSKILFTSTGADGQYDIFVANSDGSGRYNASNSARADSFASWSHDGQKIVFNSYRAANGVNNEEIYIMKFDGTEQTRLTYNPTRDTYAAISPDGTRIAFTTDRDGNREIYMMDIDGQNPVNITNHPGADQIPYWAPEDMEMISYTSYRDGNGEVYIMNSDGSNNHRVTFNSDQDVYAGWGEIEETPTVALSISDASIAEGNSGTKQLNFTVSLSQASDEWVSAVYNTTPGTALSTGAAADFVAGFGLVKFAPGEVTRNISITLNGDASIEASESFTVNLFNPTYALIADGLAVGTILNDDAVAVPGTLKLSAPSYSVGEAGPTVTLTVTRTGGSDGAVGVHFTTGNGTALAGSDFTAAAGTLSWLSGDASPRTIVIPITDDAAHESDESFYLTLSLPTGGAALGSPASAIVTITDNDAAPPPPADQGIIVYMGYVGTNAEIFSMKPDGTGVVNLSNSAGKDITPQVSDDGTMIAFASDRALAVKQDIYTMNIDGSNLRRITSDGASYEPALSPDKTKIAFTSWRSGNYEIWIADADGTNQINLTNNAFSDSNLSWTPDGRIVFTSFRADNGTNEDIYIMNANGTGLVRLTNTPGRDTYPDVSPTGNQITFTSERTGNREIFVMNADGTGQVNVSNHASSDQSSHFSPDGSKLVYQTSRNGNSELYAMNVNGTGNQRLTNSTVNEAFASWAPSALIQAGAIMSFQLGEDASAPKTKVVGLDHSIASVGSPNFLKNDQ